MGWPLPGAGAQCPHLYTLWDQAAHEFTTGDISLLHFVQGTVLSPACGRQRCYPETETCDSRSPACRAAVGEEPASRLCFSQKGLRLMGVGERVAYPWMSF